MSTQAIPSGTETSAAAPAFLGGSPAASASFLAGAPLSPGDAITATANGSAVISVSPPPLTVAPSPFGVTGPAALPGHADPLSPGAIILSGINGFLGTSADAAAEQPKPISSIVTVKSEPGADPSALVPVTSLPTCVSDGIPNGIPNGIANGIVNGIANGVANGVANFSSLGTPLITPAALNQSSLPMAPSLLSLGALAPAPQTPVGAWPLSSPLTGPSLNGIPLTNSLGTSAMTGGTASTLACALSRQQKETRDLVLKRTGKIFVGGLSQQTSSEDLRNYFTKFGEVKECFIKIDPVTNRGRGFGFVTFAEPEAIDRVMRGGPHLLDEKVVDCKLAVPQNLTEHVPLNAGGKKIFVGGVPTQANEQDLLRYFGMFGAVEHVMLMQDKETGRHRGFGFVTFEEGNIADLVVHIKYHTLHDRVMEVKEAQPKGALPKPAPIGAPNVTLANSHLLSTSGSSTNGWGLGGSQLSLPSTLGLFNGSSASSSSSGASISPPAIIGNGIPFSHNGNLFGSSPTGILDLGSPRSSLPPHPASPFALNFGNGNANTWGGSTLGNCPTSSGVIGAGRYIPYPTRRPSPGSNSSQMGFNGAAAANAAAAAAHAAAAAAAVAGQGLYYSFPQ